MGVSRNLRGIRSGLPYGMWTCRDGREVLFSRGYRPMWQRMPGECATQADPNERVPWKKAVFFNEGLLGHVHDRPSLNRTLLALGHFIAGEPLPEKLWIATGICRPQFQNPTPAPTEPAGEP